MSCRREGSDACGGAGGKVGMSSEEPQFKTMLPSGVESAQDRGASRG